MILVAGWLSVSCATAPPVQEMSDARLAIAAARDAGAAEIAADELQNAETLLDSAEDYIQSGNYTLARRDAVSAKESAFEALLTVRETIENSGGEALAP